MLMGHIPLNRHLSVMRLLSNPLCNYCEGEFKISRHFYASVFISQKYEKVYMWKFYLDLVDTARSPEGFIRNSHMVPKFLNFLR